MLTAKLFIAKLLLLLFPLAQFVPSVPATAASGGGGSAPTIVQHKAGFTGAASISVTLTSAVAAGNALLVWEGSNGGNNTPTMTGETFTHVAGASNSTGSAVDLYLDCSAAGGQTVVNGSTAGGFMTMAVVELHGAVSPCTDATGNTASTTYSVSTSASTTHANEVVVAFFYDEPNNRVWTAGTGYTKLDTTQDTSSGTSSIDEYETVSATGTQTATASGGAGDVTTQGIVTIQ